MSLPTAESLQHHVPLSAAGQSAISASRQRIRNILNADDPRMLVVVGPCSLHDIEASLEYAQRLKNLAQTLSPQLEIVMRCYLEKPRSTVGWKGMLLQPELGSSDSNGLEQSRRLLRDIAEMQLPIATECLYPAAAQYLEDLLSWACIGARTVESQLHRELASDLPCPVGLKNATSGDLVPALQAAQAAQQGHTMMKTNARGQAVLHQSQGNPDTHLVLRGGAQGSNYDAASIREALNGLDRCLLPKRLMVDCSHGNSDKDPARQPLVLDAVAAQRRAGVDAIVGVMLESHLVAGRQNLDESGRAARYGVSITDACIGWEETEEALTRLAAQLGQEACAA